MKQSLLMLPFVLAGVSMSAACFILPQEPELNLAGVQNHGAHDAMSEACFMLPQAFHSVEWQRCWMYDGLGAVVRSLDEQACIQAFLSCRYQLAARYDLLPVLLNKVSYDGQFHNRCLIFTRPDEKSFCILVLLDRNSAGDYCVADVQYYSAAPKGGSSVYAPPLTEYQFIKS